MAVTKVGGPRSLDWSSSILSPSLWAEVASGRLRSLIGQGSWSRRRNGREGLAGPFWVCLCLFGGGALQAAAAPLLAPPACPVPGGQGVLAQLLSASTNTRLSASPRPLFCPPLLTRQVWPGGGRAGVQDARVSGSLARFIPCGPSASPVCPPRHPASHPHSSSERLLSAFVCSVVSFCVMCLALALVLQLAAFS